MALQSNADFRLLNGLLPVISTIDLTVPKPIGLKFCTRFWTVHTFYAARPSHPPKSDHLLMFGKSTNVNTKEQNTNSKNSPKQTERENRFPDDCW